MQASATITETPPSLTSDDACWAAVQRHDRHADGVFYYSVASTGVYCRPSCPSRPARRDNVAFHASREAAERAGFRPCKRCRPDAPGLHQRRTAMIAAACRMIDTAVADGDPTPELASLAAAAGLSPHHFHRVFKEISGVTPKAYALAQREDRVRKALLSGETITGAIYDAGYGSSSRFYEHAGDTLGMTPMAYRDGGQGIEIRFAVGQCSLGSILVAATARGVCAILLGEDPAVLVRELQDRFAKARLVGGDGAFEALVARVVGLIEAPNQAFDLPLEVRGTSFQHRVWRALRAVPAGRTTTYAEIAARIGAPKAVRAVARACAANPVAVAIPCHRVIRSDRTLSGYAWGVERKRELLAREKVS